MQRFDLRATSHNGREETLLRVCNVLDHCHGYLLEARDTGTAQSNLLFEVSRRAVFDLYSGLLGAELDLSRDSRLRLSGLCTLRRHHPLRGGNVTVLLELSFLDEAGSEEIWSAIGFA
jgi:hypothetical protein